jgi:hypothetical protein
VPEPGPDDVGLHTGLRVEVHVLYTVTEEYGIAIPKGHVTLISLTDTRPGNC